MSSQKVLPVPGGPLGVPTSAFSPLFVLMLRVYGFALPPVAITDQVCCRRCRPEAHPPRIAMQPCCAGIWEPCAGLGTWNLARGFLLWFAACIAAYVVDVLVSDKDSHGTNKAVKRHTGMLTALVFWPLIYIGAQLQLTLLARYSKALTLMGAAGVSDRCCEPKCCQPGGCCGYLSCCGCPCGKDPGAPSEHAPLLHKAEGGASSYKGKGKEEAGAAQRASAGLIAKAEQLMRYLRYRWTLGLGVLAYIAVVACGIGVGVNFIVQVIDVVWWGNARPGVQVAVLAMGLLSALNFGMLGPTIAAWVGSAWALMFCHELQCWDWETAVSEYQVGATELQLCAEREEAEGEGAGAGAALLPADAADMGALTALSESEARFVDSAISKYNALRRELAESHGQVKAPLYAFLLILLALFAAGFRDFYFASADPHLGQQNNIVICPIIALVILAPFINLSITLDNVTKTLTSPSKTFSWGLLSVNSRVFICMHIDKHPLCYDSLISACALYLTAPRPPPTSPPPL